MLREFWRFSVALEPRCVSGIEFQAGVSSYDRGGGLGAIWRIVVVVTDDVRRLHGEVGVGLRKSITLSGRIHSIS